MASVLQHVPDQRSVVGHGETKKKEIYKYIAPWTVYGMNWSVRQDKRFRLAVGSFIEDYKNKVEIIVLSVYIILSIYMITFLNLPEDA